MRKTDIYNTTEGNHLEFMADIIGQVEVNAISASAGLKAISAHIDGVSARAFLATFWPAGKTLKNRMRTLKMGNEKLDKSIGIWSLPAVDSCPNCADCKEKCYAIGPQRMRCNVRRSRFLNWVLARFYPMAFYHHTCAQITADKVETVRIHEAGDFYSPEYVNLWVSIAKSCRATRFYFYTKTSWFELEELAGLPNVNMVESILPDGELNFGKPEYVAEMKQKYHFPTCPATDKRIDQDKVKCGKTCKLCQTRPNVLFFIH